MAHNKQITYKIIVGSIISSYHIISLLIICNFPIIQNKLLKTFLCVCHSNDNNNIMTPKQLILNHSKYALLSKILYESVHIFGKCTNYENKQEFYHCFNKSIYFSSNIISISLPLSVTTNIKTILNNNNTCNGLIVKLNDNKNYNLKYFDLSLTFISEWTSQNELFMIGNSPYRQEIFKINSIIEINNDYINDYTKWLIAIEIIIKFITGWNYDTKNIEKIILKNVQNIFMQLSNIYSNNNSYNYIPLYIKELMRKYSI
eukprot:164281_1